VVLAAWHRRRTGVLPGVAPVALLLARTDDTAVALTDLREVPERVRVPAPVALGAGRRPGRAAAVARPDAWQPGPAGRRAVPRQAAALRVQFADGRRVTNMDGYPYVPEELPPDRGLPADTLLRLTIEFADGRSVSNADSRTAGPPDAKRRAEHQLGSRRVVSGRLVPRHAIPGPALPSSGPLAFTCTWPARGIPASRVEVDGAAIRRAADVAVTLWPDDPYCSHD
jgi:hypothetical protein